MGGRLRHVREQRGLSLGELAVRAGVSKSFLWEVENDRSGISGERLLRVANVLGASLDYLLRGDRTPGMEKPSSIEIPRELGEVAEEVRLTYAQTIALLEIDRSLVARRRRAGPTTHDETGLDEALRGGTALLGGKAVRQDIKDRYLREAQLTAKRLGLPSHGPRAAEAIVDYCRSQVSHLTAEHGLPSTMGVLLERVASCLDVEFVEIHTDDDFADLVRRIPPEIEPALIQVKSELRDGTDAITIRRLSPRSWERRYLAVINCRGAHYYRRYFTKWHELSHRLVDGEQLMFAFRQTTSDRKEPGESLVDRVAAELAFFPDIVAPHAERYLRESGTTFKSVDSLRGAVAPEASRYATALALLKHSDRPAWLLRCDVSLKLSEMRQMAGQNGGRKAIPKLRVIEVSPNHEAIRSRVRIHQWMRVPESSLVTRAQKTGLDRTGREPLEKWTTSAGGPIGVGQVSVDTRVTRDEVLALVSITNEEQDLGSPG